jgi:hypothetical protein
MGQIDYRAKCHGRVSKGKLSMGRILMGRVIHGASCPWGELSGNHQWEAGWLARSLNLCMFPVCFPDLESLQRDNKPQPV